MSFLQIKAFQSLAIKLTFYYTFIFVISILFLLAGLYFLAQKTLFQLAYQEALEDFHEIRFAYKQDGLKGLQKAAEIELKLKGAQNIFIRVFDPEGKIIFETDSTPWGPLALPKLKSLERVEKIKTPKGSRALQIVFPLDQMFCEILNSLAKEENLLGRLRSILLWSAFLSIFLSVYGGLFMARRACIHLQEITRTACEIADQKDFSKKIPLKGTGDELDQLAEILNRMLDRINSLLTEMEQIIDNLAHDLRTPLTRIRMLASQAAEEREPEKIYQLQAEIMEECDSLISLLNALLDISEAKSGLLKLKLENVSLKELFNELEELFLPVAQSKGISLKIIPKEEIIRADRICLRQAIANLLDNALKYTPPGGRIELRAFQKEQNLIIEVEDTGQGIPPEEIPHIFKKFYRLDQSRSSPGRGIGLSLARAYIEAHGGHIEAESKLGQGSIFRIVLPLKEK